MAFLGACFVRRFSLNALSVPPLGQVQARFGWWVGLVVALGTLLGVLGTFGVLVGVLGCFLGTLGTFLVALGLSGAPNG